MGKLTFVSVPLIVVLAILCSEGSANAADATINIKAYIDGSDQLIISRNMLQWHHLTNAAVGRWGGSNEPTIISSTLDGNVVMNQVQWIPDWPQSPPAEIRYSTFSSIFTDLIPNVPPEGGIITDVNVTPIVCRSHISLAGYDQENIVVTFDDEWVGGPAWYEAQINVRMTPEPATLFLFGFGGLALLKKRRV